MYAVFLDNDTFPWCTCEWRTCEKWPDKPGSLLQAVKVFLAWLVKMLSISVLLVILVGVSMDAIRS